MNIEIIEDIENWCDIRNKIGGITPFKLYDWQKDAISKLSNKNIIVKARQIGFSTLCCAILYLKTIAEDGVNTKIVANKKEIAQHLLDTISIMHNSIPLSLRPKCRRESRYEFFFEDNKSRISIAADNKDVGRGETIHNLLCTEVAFWDNPEESMLGLLECVPKTGFIIIESTPNGVGNWFHKQYEGAHEIGYTSFKYDWRKHPEYDESWAEQKRKEKGTRGFAQEYDCDFIFSGGGIFIDELENYKDDLIGRVISGPNCTIQVFKEVEDDHQYVIGADTSGGYVDGDKSCFYIIDSKSRDICLEWHGTLAPDKFGKEIEKYARQYNNAFAGIEVNNHGLSTINAIKDDYSELYRRERRDKVTNEVTRELGWSTTAKSKDELIDLGRQGLRDKDVPSLPKSLKNELRTFVKRDTGETGAEIGCHDDRVMAFLISLMMVKSNPFYEFKKKERKYFGN